LFSIDKVSLTRFSILPPDIELEQRHPDIEHLHVELGHASTRRAHVILLGLELEKQQHMVYACVAFVEMP
jgi:hypothetical protein